MGHVIELRPTAAQRIQFLKAAGCARFAYNWALNQWDQEYRTGGKPNWMKLQKSFVSLIEREFPFMREIPSAAYYQPFRHVHQAYQRYFAKRARRPHFKSKHHDELSFKAGKVRCGESSLYIPKIGHVDSTEALRWQGRVISSTVKATADRWTISILCDVPDLCLPVVPVSDHIIGIDLGLTSFSTDSNGCKVQAPKPLRVYQKRIARYSRAQSRRRKGSRRRHKARMRLARLHRRIRDVRSSFLHQLSTSIVRENQTIVIEDLNVSGMLKNRRLSRAISDAGWSEFRRQLIYKCVLYRRTLIAANSFYPSSKLCSQCGHRHENLMLADRVYQCSQCGLRIDRDINAALNLRTLAQRGIDARGESQALVTVGVLPEQPTRRSVNPSVLKRTKKVG